MIKLKSLIIEIEAKEVIRQKIELLRQSLLAEYPQIKELFIHGTSQADVLHISSIKIKPKFRGHGIGSAIMDKIKKFADENGLNITLAPEAERGYKKKLDRFYKGHGFHHNTGRKKDYRLSSLFSPTMVRRPLKPITEDIDRDVESLQGKATILQYLIDQGKEPEVIDLAGDEVIIWDVFIIDDVDYPYVKRKVDWIWGHGLAQNIINGISDKLEEKRNEFFWNHPQTLYHATPKENIPSIQKDGLKPQHKSRGMTNRHISSAVFTTTEPDEIFNPAWSKDWTPGGPYGDALFAINTQMMKADGFMPEMSKEPVFAEADAVNFLTHKIKAWSEDKDRADTMGDGVSDTTIIIYSKIPPKYLSLVDHD